MKSIYKSISLILSAVFILTAGCTTTVDIFSPVKSDGYKVQVKKKGRVAVVSAVDSKINRVLAERITEGLKIKSQFRVLSQNKIKSLVPGYPRTIINFQLKGDKRANKPYLSKESKQAVNFIRSRLNVDYVILIWVEGVTKTMYSDSMFDSLNMPVYSRMIAYPSARIVAFSSFGWGKSNFTFSDDDEAVDKMINGIAMQLVFKITKATGSHKKI